MAILCTIGKLHFLFLTPMFQRFNSMVRLCGVSLIAVVAISMLGGCEDDPATSNNNSITVVKPGSGSSFVFSIYEIDSNHVKVPGSDSTETKTVTSTNLSMQGESNVYLIVSSMDTTYFSYQSNGDIKMLSAEAAGDSVVAAWLTLPVGSRAAQSATIFSDTIPIVGYMNIKWSAKHIGTANLTVGSETLATQMIEQTMETTIFSIPTVTKDTMWIAPSIGFIAQQKNFSTSVFGGGGGGSMTLTSYALK
jgi:hypothetical protein